MASSTRVKDKILITGASGFIGSFLVEEALRQGYEVYAGVRKTSKRDYLKDERIQFVELDYSSQQGLENQLVEISNRQGGLDYVIHNAGITHTAREEDFQLVNYTYTRNLAQALLGLALPLKKFVFISSLAVFGPGHEEDFNPIKVSDKKRPISSYGKSKLLAEQYLLSLSSFPYLIINPTAVYGPRDRDFFELVKLINRGIEPYVGVNQQMISLVYVKDLARAVIHVMTSAFDKKSYLISDGQGYDKEQLGETIRTILGKKTFKLKLPVAPLRWIIRVIEKAYGLFGRKPFLNVEKLNEISSANWLCDSHEIWRDIASSREFTLREGIRETIAWYRENGWL